MREMMFCIAARDARRLGMDVLLIVGDQGAGTEEMQRTGEVRGSSLLEAAQPSFRSGDGWLQFPSHTIK